MPTIFSHAVFASAVGRAFVTKRVPTRFWVLTAICAILPDLDVIGFWLGVPYDSMLGHRGLTHSIAFAAVVGLLTGYLLMGRKAFGSRAQLAVYFALVTLSHPLLDVFTNGGRGVAFFAPFSNARYFFPFRPIEVSPLGMRFFSDRGLEVLASEVIWVWLPGLLIYLVATIYRKSQAKAQAK